MHALNLGVHLWVSGNVLTELLQFDMYEGEASDNSKLALIYEEFRQWSIETSRSSGSAVFRTEAQKRP